MRICLLSDLHFEFQRDGGKSFVASCVPLGIDVLVLAGDITKMKVGFDKALGLFRRRYDCPIIYVHGNHEFYEANRQVVIRATQTAVAKLSGVHWLDGNVVEVGGRRFVGAPLWYGRSKPPAALVSTQEEWDIGLIRYFHPKARRIVNERWPDFDCVENFSSWVYEEHSRCVKFFMDNLREGDIAVSHMLPSRACVSPKYTDAPSNAFFVTNLTGLIEERKPALWLHGHTHDSIDTTIGATRVVCNPFGYATAGEINPSFKENLVIEVPDLTIQRPADRPSA